MIRTDAETIHVFAVDLPMPEAAALADDGAALSEALGGIEVEPDKVIALDTRALADLGLSSYLVEGEGAVAADVRADAGKLDAAQGPVLILHPRAVTDPPVPQSPLRHLGSYRRDRPMPEGPPIRAASAEAARMGGPSGIGRSRR